MKNRTENWVFLGDSLTEGVGSSRVSYVGNLTCLMRQIEGGKPEAERRSIHEFRLREISDHGLGRFIKFNRAGFMNVDRASVQPALCLWNLACEGRTIESDFDWLPLLEILQPERIFIFRGSLENIIRPLGVRDNQWSWWVPTSWRSYAAMDPRCYYSSTSWRRVKQQVLDRLKQLVRLRLLCQQPGVTLMSEETWLAHYCKLISSLSPLSSRIYLLGLLPVDNRQFPGSLDNFRHVNDVLKNLARVNGLQFIDWHFEFAEAMMHNSLYYLDGFHPNQSGSEVLAKIFMKIIDNKLFPPI
jgi:hypothetical protein